MNQGAIGIEITPSDIKGKRCDVLRGQLVHYKNNEGMRWEVTGARVGTSEN